MKFKVNFLSLLSLFRVCVCSIFLLTTINLYSQETKIEVSGSVKDVQGISIIGANIVEKGTTNGVSTDLDGNFSIKVSPKAILVISYVGFESMEVVVGNKTNINIILNESGILDEVVVVGYGTQKKATLTGAVSAIKNEEIITTKNENVQNMLTGKVAGLRVVQNSSEPGQFSGTVMYFQ